jgi:hypothetical protein
MKIGCFIYGFDENNFAPSVVSCQETFKECEVYAATTNDTNWKILSAACTPCCGNSSGYEENTSLYSLRSLNNITAMKFQNQSDLFSFINTAAQKFDLLFIMRSGVIFGDSIASLIDEFKDSNIGCVYSDGSKRYRSISPIHSFAYDMECVVIRSSLVPNNASNLKDILSYIYSKSIVKHIPEKLYESIYSKN